MSVWPDTRPASFHGVRFEVTVATVEAGRRRVVHDFPLRRLPGFEDLTERDGVIAVNAFLIGADVLDQRDALLAALRREGPGRLELPWIPPTQCITVSVPSWRYNYNEGRYIEVALEFLPVAEVNYPASSVNARASVVRSAEAAAETSAADFADVFSIGQSPEFVITSARQQLTEWLDQFEAVRTLQAVSNVVNSAYDWTLYTLRQYNRFSDPDILSAEIKNLFAQVTQTVLIPSDAIEALESLWDYEPTEEDPGTTPSRQAQARNREAIRRYFHRAAVVTACDAAARSDFDSHNDAIALRDALLEQIARLMEEAERSVWLDLNTLYAAVKTDLTARSETLGRVITVSYQTALPCVAISQNLYGTGARSEEIFRRNRAAIEHPAFVPSATELEVLSND